MDHEAICPECGFPLPPDAPERLCPQCLMKLGTETGCSGNSAADSPGMQYETSQVRPGTEQEDATARQAEVEKELIAQRAALNDAGNAHDWKTVETFLHPDFCERGILGVQLPRKLVLLGMKAVLWITRDFREEVQVENVRVESNQALLAVTRTDTYKMLGFIPRKETLHCSERWIKTNGRWLIMSDAVPFWPDMKEWRI